MHVDHVSRAGRRILVIANETVDSDALYDAVTEQATDLRATRVVVLAPALNTRLRHWLSDSDAARKAAVRRLQSCIGRLVRAGVSAEGVIGDADPMQAIADALHLFRAERLIIATHPEGRSNWLARDLVGRAERTFGLPVTHIVVDAAVGRVAPVPGVPADAFMAA